MYEIFSFLTPTSCALGEVDPDISRQKGGHASDYEISEAGQSDSE
jgi:hypothetical protein